MLFCIYHLKYIQQLIVCIYYHHLLYFDHIIFLNQQQFYQFFFHFEEYIILILLFHSYQQQLIIFFHFHLLDNIQLDFYKEHNLNLVFQVGINMMLSLQQLNHKIEHQMLVMVEHIKIQFLYIQYVIFLLKLYLPLLHNGIIY